MIHSFENHCVNVYYDQMK